MVLYHIAHGTCLVVELPATRHAYGFGHCDLHIVDVLVVPKRLKKGIGKAQRQQVLHCFLAQVMINTIDLLLIKDVCQLVVDFEE